ncbi:MAG: capsular biosynthesis protein, partial [Bacteroidota bacterium]
MASGLQDQIDEGVGRDPGAASPINFKRVLSRALRFWYLVVLSILVALSAAYLVNRYATKIYPVNASIIIKENEENVGAKFLYNNELVN